VFFMRSHEEELTLSLLSRFRTQPVTQEIVDRAGEIYRCWNRSHGTGANDALLAASALTTGGRIYTQNTKHYPMPGVSVRAGWKP
jgi:predicted nucleic acid-binding protein